MSYRNDEQDIMPYECALRLNSLSPEKQEDIAKKYYDGIKIWKVVIVNYERNHKPDVG